MIWIIRSNGLQQSENGCNMGGKYKVPSKELSDALVEALKDKLKD